MQPKKLLLIEDEELIRDIYKRQLQKGEFEVDAVENGGDGLVALSQTRYDLVLLDIMLPGMNGLKLLQDIKQNPNYGNTPVVILSNLGQESVVREAFEFGAEGYLVKANYTPDQVVTEIKNILFKPR